MTLQDIAQLRLINQQIIPSEKNSIKDVVDLMGAMQAQDYAMAKWAIGVRLHNTTEKAIETAISKGELIRTHVLRPTWHFVAAEDIYWLLELTAPQIKASMRSRHKQLGLTEAVFKYSNEVLVKSLKSGVHATRETLVAALKSAKIETGENRAAHLLMQAELDGLICSGEIKAGKQTYALLADRVHKQKKYTRDEALAKLAGKYFFSHGPATLEDFVWWSGLSVADSKKALFAIKSNLVSAEVEGKMYWFKPLSIKVKTSLNLLPAFDEFIISYKDRSAALALVDNKKIVSENGIFRPVIVLDGQVIGLWKRTIKQNTVVVETKFLYSIDKSTKDLVKEEIRRYGKFLGKEIK